MGEAQRKCDVGRLRSCGWEWRARMVSQSQGHGPARCQRPGGYGQSCVGGCGSRQKAGNEGYVFPATQVGLKLCLEPDHLGLDLTCSVIY